MNKLRMLCNMMVDVDRESVVSRELIKFGQLFDVQYVQVSDDPEFVDIHLSDGGVICGINRALMELNGIELREYSQPDKTVVDKLMTKSIPEEEYEEPEEYTEDATNDRNSKPTL
jgi:hypothetical protein